MPHRLPFETYTLGFELASEIANIGEWIKLLRVVRVGGYAVEVLRGTARLEGENKN